MSEYLYLCLDLGSLSIPLLYSIFERKFHYVKNFKRLTVSILIMSILFLSWDAVFTAHGIWGFNETYHLSFRLFSMPLEEYLFFFCIPYACIFTHESLRFYVKKWEMSSAATVFVSSLLIMIALVLLYDNFGKWYTTLNMALFIGLMLFAYKFKFSLLKEFMPSYLIILIPFVIVNGILTGSLISEPVVWYNDSHNAGIRFITIPIEDFFYAFSMLFMVLLPYDYFGQKERSNISYSNADISVESTIR
ncbi:lycopene cyclase domain-containing protein [Aureibacter tunicatorum]|uniref:Lycopene cyclase domain-containing protein n=1 Tax=Aureibacter tunicatorum TaxID=866807 RepID=A0AAE4BSS7_9BACT|nr:lycopene cyclase domain-containing protein [Aureibacter tunicatorum]MDR6239185.1 lycopene cyclase domain-containing protein [Aureibacter tunicatorum]BDD04889.1 hypothetical protein AUTU_23720 [Aureibacter tunicatorum]